MIKFSKNRKYDEWNIIGPVEEIGEVGNAVEVTMSNGQTKWVLVTRVFGEFVSKYQPHAGQMVRFAAFDALPDDYQPEDNEQPHTAENEQSGTDSDDIPF